MIFSYRHRADRRTWAMASPAALRRIGCRWPARQRGKDFGSRSMPTGALDAMASPAACGGLAAGGQRGKGGRIPGHARCRPAHLGDGQPCRVAADRLPMASAAKGEGFRVALDADRRTWCDGQPCRVRRIG